MNYTYKLLNFFYLSTCIILIKKKIVYKVNVNLKSPINVMRERLGCGLLLCYLFPFLNSLHLFVLSFTHPFSVIAFNVCGEFSLCLLNIHVLFCISQVLSRIEFLQYICEQK